MADSTFHYEVSETRDASDYPTTTIRCRGRLVSGDTDGLRQLVMPLITRGGRIILDLSELDYMDSSGLGAVVGLKVSAINRGLCQLELAHLSPRVRNLLTMTNLLQLFS